MTQLVLGIDPGRAGAFALLDPIDMAVVTYDMPDTLTGLHDLLASLPPVRHAMVELPFYPRMVGTRNVAVMAENFGALKSSLLWRDIPTFECRPSEWKKALGLSTDKNESRSKASQFFPARADQWKLAKHDGRAEAALIALYGYRKAR